MQSEKCFSMARLGWVSAVLISFSNCSFSPPEDVLKNEEASVPTSRPNQEEPPLHALCADSHSVRGKIILRAKRDIGSCEGLVLDPSFKINNITGKYVVLYGIPHVRYCVEIKRLNGYLSIMHDDGMVRRNEDGFTWCTIPSTRDPQSARVIALTPIAEFQLSLFP